MPTIYLAYRFREYCKFLAGAFFVSWGIQLYLYFANVSVPLLGTNVVFTPEVSAVLHPRFIFFLIWLYFGFFRSQREIAVIGCGETPTVSTSSSFRQIPSRTDIGPRAREEGKDVNHDGTPEVGRLEEGSYRYYLTTRTPKRFWDVVLKPTGDEPNLYDVNHDGKIDAKDAASPNSVAYDNTDYFHASLPAPPNSGGTGSAGCMTLDAYNYMRFLNALGSPVAQFPVSELFLPPNPQTEFSFVLVNVAPTERVGVASHSALGSR